MELFEKEFEEFCKSPSTNSAKATSYAKAIRYLCDYMGIYKINADAISKIKSVEMNISDKNSAFYQDLLKFLSGRRQRSYLEKGFIRAALKYLYEYYKEI